MTRPLLRIALHTVFAFGLGVIVATAPAVSTVTTLPSMTTMPAVAEHMHRDHPGGEQQPNPVLRKPFHDLLLYWVTLSIGDFTDRCSLRVVADRS